jgi:hypothetical protein
VSFFFSNWSLAQVDSLHFSGICGCKLMLTSGCCALNNQNREFNLRSLVASISPHVIMIQELEALDRPETAKPELGKLGE